ncbi:hypothetical protein QJS10_CPB12g01469 [Acorus calamus]|uniref:Uncharacterized protein n=1 Tax=Acorus calamus TaxID=4465 RepID=A0AAV9DMF5_ACOCL|nr:hypothetical protein QJS10_CPB12g01469 [Acorus calamus]
MEFLGLRKGAWTHEEDLLLRKCVEELGEGKWRQIPVRAGLNRCRKSCRLRWLNYLRPNLRRGEFDKDEVDLILRLHKLLGNKPQPWRLQRNQWRLHQFDGHDGLRLGEGLINQTTTQDTSMDDQVQWPWKDFLLHVGEEEKCFSSTKSVSGEDQTTKISSSGGDGGGEYGTVGGGGGVEREEDMFLEDLFKLVGEEWEIL